jgi:hypothetical protein
MKIIDTRTDIDNLGDIVPDFDLWMNGAMDYADLSEEDKKAADRVISASKTTS